MAVERNSDGARSAPGHIPVLLGETIEILNPAGDGLYIDGTFGAGGYARALLDHSGVRVVGIDRDPASVAAARDMAAEYAPRLSIHHKRFSQMADLPEIAAAVNTRGGVDGVALDLGVSSMQIDDPGRGFSFQADGPLDMRMGADGPSAADIVNTLPEQALARIFAVLGEERRARGVARAIVAARAERPITRTAELAGLVARVMGPKARARKIHPATRVFQALRLYVNRELDELAQGLAAAERLIRPEGRLAVVTFHSLEDRIVKRFFSARSRAAPNPSRHVPLPVEDAPAPSFRDLTPGGVIPGEAEIAANPRARSARLRAGARTRSAPFPADEGALGLPRLDGLEDAS